MAAPENHFKKTMDESEKVAIAIEKLPVEYQPVPAEEMRKGGTLVTAQHIENAAFQHWQSVHGSYANNSVIDGASQDTKETRKELALAAFNRTCNRCGCRGHKEAECYAKKHINGQSLTPKNNSGESGMSSCGNGGRNSNQNQKKKWFEGTAITVESLDTRKLIVAKMQWTTRKKTKSQQLRPCREAMLSFCCVLKQN